MLGFVAPKELPVPVTIKRTTWLLVVPVLQEDLKSSLHAIRVTKPLKVVSRSAVRWDLGLEGNVKKSIPACSVTDGSAATPWTTGNSGAYEPCKCAGAAKTCSALNVCDVAKKTCVCTPGKDHWCYQDSNNIFAVKFKCYKASSNDQYYQGYKCDGDSVVAKRYSDDKCTTEVTVENGGRTEIFTSTKKTQIRMDSGSKKTEEDTTITGISTCKGGVAAPSEAEKKKEAGNSPSPSSVRLGNGDENAGSVTQCSTLAMLIVVVTAMWAGRN